MKISKSERLVRLRAATARAEARTAEAKARSLALTRRHKNIIHFTILVFVGVSLYHEGGGWADWGFVCLAIVCEAG